jgi:hypothetical protein
MPMPRPKIEIDWLLFAIMSFFGRLGSTVKYYYNVRWTVCSDVESRIGRIEARPRAEPPLLILGKSLCDSPSDPPHDLSLFDPSNARKRNVCCWVFQDTDSHNCSSKALVPDDVLFFT